MNIEDYLTDERKQEIAEEVFRDKCIVKFKQDDERIFSNAAYHVVSKMCDDNQEDLKELLLENTKGVIKKLSASTVFNKPDAWDRDGNSSYHLLKSIVDSKRERIDNKVNSLIDQLTLPDDFDIDIQDEVREMIINRLFGESK